MPAPSPFVLGLDIGYSGLKLAYGPAQMEPVVRNLPTGAAPLTQMPRTFAGEPDLRGGVPVLVAGVPWAAAVQPDQIQGYTRVLHEDYPSSEQYLALLHAALAVAGREVIDVLVTGLPVSQHAEAGGARRRALAERLQRVHYIDGRRAVEVRRVDVLAQPVGAYMHELVRGTQLRRYPGARVLVVDPGYYSLDWVCIENRAVRDMTSGTTTDAMSRIIEFAAAEIVEAHRPVIQRVPAERIEHALRIGADTILAHGREITVAPFVEAAAGHVAASAVTAIRGQMRAGEGIDFIVLTGGAAPWYTDALRRAFPDTEILMPEHPVMANAVGFFFAGRRRAAEVASAEAEAARA